MTWKILSDQQIGESNTTKVLELLEQKLPPYIINCFKASGFDEIEVILEMDISEKSGNSIEKLRNLFRRNMPPAQIITLSQQLCYLNFHLGIDFAFVIL